MYMGSLEKEVNYQPMSKQLIQQIDFVYMRRMNVVCHQNIFSRVNTFSVGSSQDMDMMAW